MCRTAGAQDQDVSQSRKGLTASAGAAASLLRGAAGRSPFTDFEEPPTFGGFEEPPLIDVPLPPPRKKCRSEKTGLVPSCEVPQNATREQLLGKLFDALCPQDMPARLGASQLQRFAELCGFKGSTDDWMEEYQAICSVYRWDVRAGANFAQFAAFVDDEESSGFCTDKELLGLFVESGLVLRNAGTVGVDQEARCLNETCA